MECVLMHFFFFFFFQAEDGIRDLTVTGVQTCALPIARLPAARVAPADRADHGESGRLGPGADRPLSGAARGPSKNFGAAAASERAPRARCPSPLPRARARWRPDRGPENWRPAPHRAGAESSARRGACAPHREGSRSSCPAWYAQRVAAGSLCGVGFYRTGDARVAPVQRAEIGRAHV